MTRHLQPVDGLFVPAVNGALQHVTLTEADAAAALLARLYAKAIDEAEDRDVALERFGPRLLAALTALRATPAARGAGKPQPAKGGKLQAMRQARPA